MDLHFKIKLLGIIWVEIYTLIIQKKSKIIYKKKNTLLIIELFIRNVILISCISLVMSR